MTNGRKELCRMAGWSGKGKMSRQALMDQLQSKPFTTVLLSVKTEIHLRTDFMHSLKTSYTLYCINNVVLFKLSNRKSMMISCFCSVFTSIRHASASSSDHFTGSSNCFTDNALSLPQSSERCRQQRIDSAGGSYLQQVCDRCIVRLVH